jgi:hypothetical protein
MAVTALQATAFAIHRTPCTRAIQRMHHAHAQQLAQEGSSMRKKSLKHEHLQKAH